MENSPEISMRSPTALALLTASLLGGSPAVFATAACSVSSGPQRATLIELFTSEGCSSCPPADRWLSGFASSGQTKKETPIVPLAFHVDYWDYIGWTDRFARPAFTARQKERQQATQGRFIYTPQTVVNARDSSDWRRAGRPGLINTGSPITARAELQLSAEPITSGGTIAHLTAQLLPAASASGKAAVAYLALYENGLASEVHSGENAGRQLRHDYVVREWIGPLAFAADGHLDSHQRFSVADVNPSRSGIAAIVESSDGSQLHQALALPLCP
jgi:hypothetical protein